MNSTLFKKAGFKKAGLVLLAGHWYPQAVLQQLESFAEEQANSIRLNLHLLWDMLMSAPMRQQFAD